MVSASDTPRRKAAAKSPTKSVVKADAKPTVKTAAKTAPGPTGKSAEPIGKSERKPFFLVILGPHRSGTSALAGLLSRLGADLPASPRPASSDNPAGYFESARVTRFNETMLDALGAGWRDLAAPEPEAMSDQVRQSFTAEALQILRDEFATARLPVLKDPRLCRLAGFWSDVLSQAGYQPLYIHIHRAPSDMAASLAARDGIALEKGQLIWLRHMLDAEAATRGAPRVFTSYEALLGNWRDQVALIEKGLGVSFHRRGDRVRQEIDAFLSPALRHHSHDQGDLRISVPMPEMLGEAVAVFEAWAGTCGNPADQRRLDRLRGQLNSALDPVATIMQSLEREREQSATLVAGQGALIATLERERDEGAALIRAQSAQLALLEADLRQRGLEAEEWFAENGRHAEVIRTLEADHALELQALQGRLSLACVAPDAVQDAELRAELQTERAERASLESSYAEERAQLQSELRALRQQSQVRFSEIAQLSSMLLEAQTQTGAGEDAGPGSAEARLEAVLSSTSWKITAPLRRIVMLFRR